MLDMDTTRGVKSPFGSCCEMWDALKILSFQRKKWDRQIIRKDMGVRPTQFTDMFL